MPIFKFLKVSLFALTLTVSINSCSNKASNDKAISIEPFKVTGLDTIKTNSGLQYILVKQNIQGKLPSKGKQVKVHYTGYFSDGKIFDSSVKRGESLPFTLGVGQVIMGWDEGIALLHVGEKARLIIPYTLAYGVEGSGPIPPLSTLIFDVELVEAD